MSGQKKTTKMPEVKLSLPNWDPVLFSSSQGLNSIFTEKQGALTTSLALYFKIGSRYESESELGLSHLIEHMLFKGTESFTAKEIIEKIEGTGSQINAYTTENYTCIHMQTLPGFLGELLPLFLEIAFKSRFATEELEKEKEVVIDEITSSEEAPSYQLQEIFSQACWGKHPLSHPVMGFREQIKAYSKKDLEDFYENHFIPEKAVLSCVGDLKLEHYQFLIEEALESLSLNRKVCSLLKEKIPRLENRFLYTCHDTQQCHVEIGFPHFVNSRQSIRVMELIDTLLGQNMSSLLFQTLREELGYAYHIQSEYTDHGAYGLLSIEFITDKETFVPCLKSIKESLKHFSSTKVSLESLEKAKAYLLGGLLIHWEDPLSFAQWLGENYISCGELTTPKEAEREILGISPKQVEECLKGFNPKNKDLILACCIVSENAEEEVSQFEKIFSNPKK